ncbi:hypothetical protein [Vibrio campbellii]|uniref:hypothetical protein n=1 Tax=Vibrio campbellii TaxID=680 RepID=UPI003F856C1B
MELSSSAITGSMRLGVQVVSSHKEPVLEIYHQLRNQYDPEVEYQLPLGVSGEETATYKSRRQNIFIEFNLANIGGSRAENIKLTLKGSLRRNAPRESFGDLFDTIIPQMPPGQVKHLFQFQEDDLFEISDNCEDTQELKDSTLTIVMEYDVGPGVLNWILSIWSKLKGKRRFKQEYTFFPKLVTGDLPPSEYLG